MIRTTIAQIDSIDIYVSSFVLSVSASLRALLCCATLIS